MGNVKPRYPFITPISVKMGLLACFYFGNKVNALQIAMVVHSYKR